MEEILILQKQAFWNEGIYCKDMCIAPLVETLDEIRDQYYKQIFIKATSEDNSIIGSVRGYIKADIAYIGRLIAHEDFQNKGLGKALMEEIEKELNSAKCYELFTGKHNVKTNYFYQKIGYNKLREEKISDILTFVYYVKTNELVK